MGKIVKNSLGGGFVIYAEGRSERPRITAEDAGACPFCQGNERLLPEIKYETPNVIVCKNKYPALERTNGEYGVHEVVIDTRDHYLSTHNLPAKHIAETLFAIRLRCAELSNEREIRSVYVFKNQGQKAGASISHSHWQILAVPFRADEPYKDGFSPLEQLERDCEVISDDNFTAFCPAASCFSYEVWLAPKRPRANFLTMSDEDVNSFALVLKSSLTALSAAIDDLSYNLVFYNHGWFFARIVPRNAGFAGFELSGGGFINSVSPINAAAHLRTYLN